jgi:hypothetical protein
LSVRPNAPYPEPAPVLSASPSGVRAETGSIAPDDGFEDGPGPASTATAFAFEALGAPASPRHRGSTRLMWCVSALFGATLLSRSADEDWPAAANPRTAVQAAAVAGTATPRGDAAVQTDPQDLALIRERSVCVLNTLSSAGEIGQTLAFRSHREGDRLNVSYFVYWSTERPWGDRSLLESLAIDSVYSHFLFVLPGLRYVMHGPGDIEGATVVYRVDGADDERLEPPARRARGGADGPGRQAGAAGRRSGEAA